MKTYYSISMNQDLFGKPLYLLEIINFSESGKYIRHQNFEFHDIKSRNNLINEMSNSIKISKNSLNKAFNNHIEPKKETKIISMKEYLKQIEQEKILGKLG